MYSFVEGIVDSAVREERPITMDMSTMNTLVLDPAEAAKLFFGADTTTTPAKPSNKAGKPRKKTVTPENPLGKKDPRYLYLCPICHSYYNSEATLYAHIQKHRVEKFECLVCKELFNAFIHLVSHVRMYHNLVDYFCMKCNKMFIFKMELDIHNDTIHKRGAKLKLNADGTPEKKYISNATKGVHLSETSYVATSPELCRFFFCHNCNGTFLEKNDQKDHYCTSSEPKSQSFICNICNYKCVSQVVLTGHKLNTHESLSMADKLKVLCNSVKTLKKPEGNFMIHCIKCRKDETWDNYFNLHWNTCKICPFCSYCGDNIYTKSTEHLENHFLIKHRIVQCGVCKFHFFTPLNLFIHVMNTHFSLLPKSCDYFTPPKKKSKKKNNELPESPVNLSHFGLLPQAQVNVCSTNDGKNNLQYYYYLNSVYGANIDIDKLLAKNDSERREGEEYQTKKKRKSIKSETCVRPSEASVSTAHKSEPQPAHFSVELPRNSVFHNEIVLKPHQM